MTDQEKNEAVARKLGVIPKVKDCNAPFCEHSILSIKDYCHSISAAFEIVEHLSKQFFGVSVSHDNLRKLWQCGIETIKEPGQYETADTAPMAIVNAFLKLDGQQ